MSNQAILQELHPRTILFYARDLTTLQSDLLTVWNLIQELWPVREVDSLTYEYWKGENQRPVMAEITAFDAEASIATRQALGAPVRGDMPKITRKIKLGEQEEILLQRILANAALPQEVRDYIRRRYDDITAMRDAVLTRYAKLAFDLLSNTDISVNENGVVMTISGIGVPASNLKTVTTPWTDPASKPYDDEQAWLEQLVDAGIDITGYRVLTSEKVLRAMLRSDQIRELVYRRSYTGAEIPAVTRADFDAWRAAQGLPPIATLDVQVRAQAADGTFVNVRLFPQDRYVLLPPGNLGETLIGPTIEAIRMMEQGVISFGEVRGIWAGEERGFDPPVKWTKACAVMFPTFPQADAVISADVL